MPEQLTQSTPNPPGRPPKYDLKKWILQAEKSPLRLLKGTDFSCKPKTITGLLYDKAKKLGFKVSLKMEDFGHVVIRKCERIDTQ